MRNAAQHDRTALTGAPFRRQDTGIFEDWARLTAP
jgi:hypothetical protein